MAESKTKTRKRSSGSSKSSSGSSKSGTSRKSSSGSSKSSSSSGKSSSGASSSRSSGSSNRSSNSTKQSATDVVRDAVRELQGLIGRPVEAVTGIEKNGSEWNVTVEVVELERIPNTTDVLGVYEVTVDKNGELTGTRRTRRFYRSEAGED